MYLLPDVAVAMSPMSFPHAPPQYHVLCSLLLWQCGTPNILDHYVSSVVRPPGPTSPPLHSSSAADVTPQDTLDPLVASPSPHTKPIAHALSQKTYSSNQIKLVPNPLRRILSTILSPVRQRRIMMIMQLIQ
jgi:hypothetical protein